jgi:hypothetical protein
MSYRNHCPYLEAPGLQSQASPSPTSNNIRLITPRRIAKLHLPQPLPKKVPLRRAGRKDSNIGLNHLLDTIRPVVVFKCVLTSLLAELLPQVAIAEEFD